VNAATALRGVLRRIVRPADYEFELGRSTFVYPTPYLA
jgi:hypothetical protein